MKKLIKLFYAVFIFALLCIPVGAMKLYTAENTENRELAEMPHLFEEDFGSKFESYISDHFAFRDVLVNTDSSIKADIFGMSGNDSVTVGKEDWLFFSETIDDVTSKNTMSDREAYCAARTLELMSEYVQHNSGRFIFMPAPNKASLYDEYLPYYYKKSNIQNNYDKVVSRLQNVEYLDLKALFENQDEVLYHKFDSHWNNKGALIVVNDLLDYLNLDKNEYSEPEKTQDWEGDLYKMLFPDGSEKDFQYCYNDNQFDYTYTKRFKSVDDMLIFTENNNSENGSILLFRDSFGRSMLPFIGESFSSAVLSRSVPYDISCTEDTHFDYVVLEIVERNIEDIISRAPYMNALEADIPIDTLTMLDTDEYDVTHEADGLNHIYGNIKSDVSEDTRIFVSVGDKLYEAFPCYELGEDEESDGNGNGFSLYTDNTSNEINIYILNK